MVDHSRQGLIRYLHGDLSGPERARVESHLKTCNECREFLVFVRNFNATLKEMAAAELQPDTPCPDPEMLAAFRAGELHDEAAQQIRQHTVFCKDCLEELYLLRQAEESPRIEAETPVAAMSQGKWRGLVEKLKASVVDLGRKYGMDTLVGSCRILSEIPRLYEPVSKAYLRSPQVVSKTVQVEQGKNLYAITVETSVEADQIECEVSTLRESVKSPLDIFVRSTTGMKLIAARTNEHGFSHCTVSGRFLPDELLLLTLNIERSEQHLLFRVPLEKLSATSKLSYIERAIFGLVAQGYGTETISKMLSLNKQAAKAHLGSIFHKLGLHTVAALNQYATGFRPTDRTHILQGKDIPPYVVIYRIHGPFLFGATDKFAEIFDELDSLPPIVILRLRNMTAIDATGLGAIRDLADTLHKSGRSLLLCGVRKQPAKLILQAEFKSHVGAENICLSIADALQRAAKLYESQHAPAVGILHNYKNLVPR